MMDFNQIERAYKAHLEINDVVDSLESEFKKHEKGVLRDDLWIVWAKVHNVKGSDPLGARRLLERLVNTTNRQVLIQCYWHKLVNTPHCETMQQFNDYELPENEKWRRNPRTMRRLSSESVKIVREIYNKHLKENLHLKH